MTDSPAAVKATAPTPAGAEVSRVSTPRGEAIEVSSRLFVGPLERDALPAAG
jgi:hypothetical protein